MQPFLKRIFPSRRISDKDRETRFANAMENKALAEVEEYVLRLILDEELEFTIKRVNRYALHGLVSKGGVFKLYEERTPNGEVFPYLTVKGVDYEVNHRRLKKAITEGVDIGYDHNYSWV
jgi:hypothetical protein